METDPQKLPPSLSPCVSAEPAREKRKPQNTTKACSRIGSWPVLSRYISEAKTRIKRVMRAAELTTETAKVLKLKSTDVFVIETDTDGGTYIGLFYTNGKEIADGSAGESGDWGWN